MMDLLSRDSAINGLSEKEQRGATNQAIKELNKIEVSENVSTQRGPSKRTKKRKGEAGDDGDLATENRKLYKEMNERLLIELSEIKNMLVTNGIVAQPPPPANDEILMRNQYHGLNVDEHGMEPDFKPAKIGPGMTVLVKIKKGGDDENTQGTECERAFMIQRYQSQLACGRGGKRNCDEAERDARPNQVLLCGEDEDLLVPKEPENSG